MKIAVLSDIHANLAALQSVIEQLSSVQIDSMIIAGDMIGGPQPDEVLECLAGFHPWMIQGNNEQYVLKYADGTAPDSWYTHRQWGYLRRSYQLTGKQWVNYISRLPEQAVIQLDNAPSICVVHGSPRNVNELLFPDPGSEGLRQALEDTSESVLICGHSHLPWIFKQNGRLVVNPGAVTGGLNRDPRAQYAMLDWDGLKWEAELCAATYDISKTISSFEQSGLLFEGGGYARGCMEDLKTGENKAWAFVQFAYSLAMDKGVKDLQRIPDETWLLAEQEFHW